MKARTLIPTLLLAALLSACASTPRESEALNLARQAVTEAEQNPAVHRHAPVPLGQAKESLERAEALWRAGEEPETAEHLAYMARQRANIAQALTERELAVLSGFEAAREREQILLQNRERELAEARAEAEQLRAQSAKYQDQLAQQEAQLRDIRSQLADMEPKQTERGIVLTLDEVLFSFDSAELKPGTRRSMDRLAQYLRENPDFQILIEGHTDSVGDSGYNQRLSERRADAVRGALAQRGIEGERIRVMGLGEDFPVADNSTAPGRAENRRVEVVIAQNEFPPTREEATRPVLARERQAPPSS